ncbi:MAG TPA: 3-deoxy-D-manno-octulosonic acid transferase [Pyrinomonadaceae bacterium]|nr:3-deoxy-D-manno-octulosonic acid transferase [Pyrinomonadaceae bacterium]
MYLAYSLLLTVGLLVLIPHFIYQALAHGKYLSGLRQRLGSIPELPPSEKPVIWLHSVSVGETQAARTIIESLKQAYPNHTLVVSTITQTGQNLAKQVLADRASSVFYFPFDWKWSVRRALARVKPSLVLLMETELWPNFLNECAAQSIPVALVNGRISRQSFRRYSLISRFMKRVLGNLNLAIMQTEKDAERIKLLGVPEDRLFISGNLKFDSKESPLSGESIDQLNQRFALSSRVPLILAASTHEPEERILLESFAVLRKSQPARLMIAPRHPQRFEEVASLIQAKGLNWTRRTSNQTSADADVDVILLDSIGELPSLYRFASICFVGGSIVDKGGHNVLEPASVGTCIVTGAHTHNFDEIVNLLLAANGLEQLPPLELDSAADTLAQTLIGLLRDDARRVKMGKNGLAVVAANRGSTLKTIGVLKTLINASSVREPQDSLLASNAS